MEQNNQKFQKHMEATTGKLLVQITSQEETMEASTRMIANIETSINDQFEQLFQRLDNMKNITT